MKVSGSITYLALAAAASAIAEAADDASWDAATVYAIIDKNEWCWGGSIHVDLWTGDYVLVPRPQSEACVYRERTYRPIERGAMSDEDLAALRAAYRRVVTAGIEMRGCQTTNPAGENFRPMISSNGGPEVLTIAGPLWSFITPHADGCWSREARALHRALFDIFGEQRPSVPASIRDGRRTIPD